MPRKLVGRPTKYKANYPDLVLGYIKECEKEDKLPQVAELCVRLEINNDTLYSWVKINKKFSDTIDRLKKLQELMLVQKGISRKYDPSFARFILAANHGYVETSKTINEGNQPVTIQVDMSGGYVPPKTVTGPHSTVVPKPLTLKSKPS